MDKLKENDDVFRKWLCPCDNCKAYVHTTNPEDDADLLKTNRLDFNWKQSWLIW